MLSSGVESPLDSSVSDGVEQLYPGLPESVSAELMAVSESNVGLDAKSNVSAPRDSLSAEQRGTSGVENFCQKTEDLGDKLKVVSHRPAESLAEDSVKAGDLEEDEKSNFRKRDCTDDGCQKEDKEAQDAEEYPAACCALIPRESWSKQDGLDLNQHEVKCSGACCTQVEGSLKNTEEKQANVQVTAETLPKLIEEVQGMKADGTRIFSKAGYRNDQVSKGLPLENNECPDVDTVMARAGVSETSTIDFLEPLKVMDMESDTDHPQETNYYHGLKAHAAMPVRTGGNESSLETREEKLPRLNPVNEFSTSVANCQTYQQDEENNAYDFCTGPVPKHNEPYRLSSVESCRMLSTKSSEVSCSVLKSSCYLDFRNMPLGNNSTAVHGIIDEPPKKYLHKTIKSQTHDHGTGFVENGTSTSLPVEQVSIVFKGLSTAKTDHREVSASIGKLYSSEFEEASEIWRKIAVGENIDVCSWPEAQEDANSEHCHSSVFSSVASSPEEFSKENFKMVPSEGDKLKKNQWQFPVSDLCKDDIKENSLLMETSKTASHEIGQTDKCFYSTSSKMSPPSSHSCLDLSTKLEEDSPEAQVLEMESESNTTLEELAGSSVQSPEANSNENLSTGKETHLIYTLNVALPAITQKLRERCCHECPPCIANEVSNRDKPQDNPSGKESIGASGTTEEQVTQTMLHQDKFKSSVISRTSDNPTMTSKISQKDMNSSVGNTESVVTALGNEHSDTWNFDHHNIKDQCTAASTSCVLSGSTSVDDVLRNSHSCDVEIDKKIEKKYNWEGEDSAEYNSKKIIIFPEAHFPLSCGSLPCEEDWGNRGVDLHGINGSEIPCNRNEAKEQTGTCALQTDGFEKIRTVDTPKAPGGNQRNKTSEELLGRYFNKKPCTYNFGFCNSPLGPKERETGTYEKKEVSLLPANTSERSTSICDMCPLLRNMNIQTRRASQPEKTLCPMENHCLACQNELDGLVPGSKQHLESLNNQRNTGLQTTATSVEKTKISIGSSPSEQILLETGDDLPPLAHKYARGDSFQGTINKNVVDLDSLHGVRNEDCSGYTGFVGDVIGEETIRLKEHENGCERENKGTREVSFYDCKAQCSQHGHSMPTVKDMDVTSPKSTCYEEKLKNKCEEENMRREVAHRKNFLIDSFLDGEDCLWASLEDSQESGSKTDPLSTESYEKVLEEISRSNQSNPSKQRKNYTKLTNLARTSLLSETVCGCQAEDAASAETSPELQCDTTPPFYPHMSIQSNSCKEIPPNCVVCSKVCVPYKLNAQSKDNIKEVTEGRDTEPTHSLCKENEALGSERCDQIEKCQLLKRKKKYEKMKVHQSNKAQPEHKSEYGEKAKLTLQPRALHSSKLLRSSPDELVTSRNKEFRGPSEEIFAVRSSENKLCSTLQEVKRPKITTDTISSQFLKTQDSETENLNLNLGYDGIPGAFETTNKLRGPVPLKRQPGRTCKKVPTSYQLKTIRKNKKCKSSSFCEISPEIFPKQENTDLKSLYFPCKPPAVETETAMKSVHLPRQRAKRCGLLSSLRFRKCTKEPALLSKLTAVARNLLAPAKSIHHLKSLPRSSEILPVGERYSQRVCKNLLEAFSCINRNLHSRWADSWCTKMFSFQPLALYPVESTKILFSDLSHKPPTSFLDTPVFPISFHIKLDSSPATDLTGITSQHSVHLKPVLGEMEAPPSKWTFSFLLSQSCSDTTAFKEDSHLDNELHSSLSVRREVALHPDHGRNVVAERRRGCSMLGLHTVLALSSPGCYRIWTRRRNLTSHIPTIQRLFISQFAQGLKGARHPASVSDDLVSSLPYSLGRVLSIWSQHGPAACPSEITPLHSNHCKWQPSVGIENSCAMLPHLPVQSMEALQTAGHEICLETSFPFPLPKPCALPEPLPSPPRLAASELQVCALDEADAPVPACLRSQDDTELKKTETEKRPKKVSQIRIRKTVPKPDPNLTPMGLPKPKRLKKKEFSLEEIYTNKNYKSPPPARSLETIFEEPKEKNGCLISVSQQKRKRILEFQDFTLPRKRKTRGKVKAVGSYTRAKKAALQSAELDALLSQKLMDLEAFFAEEAEQE
ncbi:PREDICTED: protein PRR14L [Chaetura pelagica]|uniref:protein PRR14L n=1 Tax=Chaetura pelagica TaxID=8897 RepID=UPI000523856F|nr:PREDICTED: protein PRR14L [Chaetura pelagica]